MYYAIELYMDNKSEKLIRAFSKKMRKARLGPGMSETCSRPHIALSVFKTGDPAAMEQPLRNFASHLKPFTLSFGQEQLGIFTNTGVVFLAPVVSRDLLRTHQKCWEKLGRYMRKTWDYYKMDKLFFHCTLGLNMPPHQILKTVELAMKSKFPNIVKIAGMALVAIPEEPVPRVKELFFAKFKG